MINLVNGNILDGSNIEIAENKESAIILLNLHEFLEIGEIYIVGFGDEDNFDVMAGVCVKPGIGPDTYRLVMDQGLQLVTHVYDSMPDVSVIAYGSRYLAKEDGVWKYLSRIKLDSGDTEIDKKEATEKCIILDAISRDIYLLNPPNLISFLDLPGKSFFESIQETPEGIIASVVDSTGKKYEGLYFGSSEEKQAQKDINDQLQTAIDDLREWHEEE